MAKYALVCGVNTYDNGAFRPLFYGINDAVRMKNLLSSCEYEVDILPGEKFRDSSLRKALKAIVERTISGDTILFYFSGHGCALAGEQFVLPYNATFDGQHLENGINLGEVAKLTDKPGVKRLFVIDACRDLFQSKSAVGKDEHSLTQKGIANLLNADSEQSMLSIVCACSDGRFSFESKALRGGIFTSMLIEVFITRIEGGERLSLFDVTKEVDDKLEMLPERVGEYFPQQSPWVLGENLVLLEGIQYPAYSTDYFDRYLDIESEYMECEYCAESSHFIDLKRCLTCNRLICPEHFENSDDVFCRICVSEGLKIVELNEIRSITTELRKRKKEFFDAFSKVCPSGTLRFNQNSTPEKFVNEFCAELFAQISKKQTSGGVDSILKRDMLLEAFYGIIPAQLVDQIKPYRLFSAESDLVVEWEGCELKLRRALLWGEHV